MLSNGVILMDNLMKEEWIDGSIMMSPRPMYNHMEIERTIGIELENYFKGKCKVATEYVLFLTKDDVVELKKDLPRLKALISAKKAELVPDVAVYCDKEQIFKRGFLGIPQLVVEVLSYSNSTDDTEKKKEVYRKYGVPEYWIANPETKEIFVYSLENGVYEQIGIYNFLEEEIKSARFADLVVDIKKIELYEDDDDEF
jgi:Uma2 family endonuclease